MSSLSGATGMQSGMGRTGNKIPKGYLCIVEVAFFICSENHFLHSFQYYVSIST